MNRVMTSGKAGASLLELIVYFGLLAVVLNICSMTFVRANRLSAMTSTLVLRQQAVDAFALDATRAIHNATSVLPQAGIFTTDETHVVLQNADGVDVIGTADKKLARWSLVRDGDTWRIDRVKAFAFPQGNLRISIEPAGNGPARRVTLQVSADANRANQHACRLISASMRAVGAVR